MNNIKNIKKLLVAAIMAGLFVPQLSHCAALPERSDISPEQQEKLNTLLLQAICSHNLSEIQTTLDAGANPNTPESANNETPLITALSCKSSSAIIDALLKAGANPNRPSRYEHQGTTLHMACKLYDLETTKLLINAGVDLNARRGMIGYSPLMQVIFHSYLNHPETHTIIQTLINANADLNMLYNHDRTALMYAAQHGTPEIVRQLILAGADETQQNKYGSAVSYYATKNDTYSNMPQIIQNALQKRSQNIQRTPHPTLKRSHNYLLNGPLPINPLTRIFLSYATDPVIIAQQKADAARDTQQKRADETRKKAAEWQATQQARRKQQTTAATCCVIS